MSLSINEDHTEQQTNFPPDTHTLSLIPSHSLSLFVLRTTVTLLRIKRHPVPILSPFVSEDLPSEHYNDMRGSCQEWPPIAQCLDYCKEFQIIDVIVTFCLIEGHQVIANWVALVIFTTL